jgi:hypothetical protein
MHDDHDDHDRPRPVGNWAPHRAGVPDVSFFTNLTNALASAGVNASSIPGILSGVASFNSVSSRVNALLNQLAADSASPAAVGEIVTQIEATPGVPSNVIPLLETLRTPGITQLQVFQTITAIEAAVAQANSVL